MSPAEQWDKTVRFWLVGAGRYLVDRETVRLPWLGVVRIASKWTRIGDVLIEDWGNGNDRFGWTGVSSKGRHLLRYYQTARPRKKGGRVDIFELPGEIAALPPLHPGVRAFVLDNLRAGDCPAPQ